MLVFSQTTMSTHQPMLVFRTKPVFPPCAAVAQMHRGNIKRKRCQPYLSRRWCSILCTSVSKHLPLATKFLRKLCPVMLPCTSVRRHRSSFQFRCLVQRNSSTSFSETHISIHDILIPTQEPPAPFNNSRISFND